MIHGHQRLCSIRKEINGEVCVCSLAWLASRAKTQLGEERAVLVIGKIMTKDVTREVKQL